jgi:uncharacterized Zn finger protein
MIPDGRIRRRQLTEALDLIDRVSELAVERDPLILSGVVEGTFHYSAYIDETGDYCCSCIGQTTHKGICKHIIALIIHAYLNNHITRDEAKKLIGGKTG